MVQERTERAARQLARGQEQLVLLLLTAIVTYLARGQVKAGVVGSMESIATRSAKLQAEISNKQLAGWLARNEQKLVAQPELHLRESAPLQRANEPVSEAAPNKPSNAPKTETLPRHKLGAITGTDSSVAPAPLDPRLAETFTGGRYNAVILENDTILKRAGVEGQPLGQFFGQEAPSGILQTRMTKPSFQSGLEEDNYLHRARHYDLDHNHVALRRLHPVPKAPDFWIGWAAVLGQPR